LTVVAKLVPTRVTLVPLVPVVGEKLIMDNAEGGGMVKSAADEADWLSTCTVIFPEEAPAGTLTVIEVAVEAVTGETVPLNFTKLLAGVIEKLVPVRVTTVPEVPDVGENPVIVGAITTGLAGSSLSLHELPRRKKILMILNCITFFIAIGLYRLDEIRCWEWSVK
jgi:hypothetical protein